MVDVDYSRAFSCPKCGEIGNIYLVKVAGSKIVIKQRCPVHGGRAFKIPLKDKDKKMLLDILKAKTSKQLNIKEVVDKDLISGFMIVLGNLVLDGSLRFKIREKAKELIVETV